MKKLLILGIIPLLLIVLVSAQPHGVTICTTSYNCGPADGVCPLDFGTESTSFNCDFPYCDPNCMSYYDSNEACLCDLNPVYVWIGGYGCCGDDDDEDNPFVNPETGAAVCTNNRDDNCNGDIDCEEYAVGAECPPPACGNCRKAVCNHANYDWEMTQLDCTPACCVFESPAYCADCACGDGVCNCGEPGNGCILDCACLPGTPGPCPLTQGVCAGSQQICDASGHWPGCDEDNYNSSGKFQWEPEHWCDALDNDCDGYVDERCDSDRDRFCDDYLGLNDTDVRIIEGTDFPDTCGPPPNSCCNKTDATDSSTIAATDDCNDADPSINPDGTEWCGDNEDYNCDGEINDFGEGDPCGERLCADVLVCNAALNGVFCGSNGTDCTLCCLCNATGKETYDPGGTGGDCTNIFCPQDICDDPNYCQPYEWSNYSNINSWCFDLFQCQHDAVVDCVPDCDDADADGDNYSTACIIDCDDDPSDDSTDYDDSIPNIDIIDIDDDGNFAEHIHPGATSYCGNGVDEDCVSDPPCGCNDIDGDGYGFPGSTDCTYPETDCADDFHTDDPAYCPTTDPYTPPACNATTTMCSYCINPSVDETYNNVTGINYCSDIKDNDCDTKIDFNDTGCKAIVEGYTTYWNTGRPLPEVLVTGYPPGMIVSSLTNLSGYYNMTTLAGKYFFGAYKEGYSTFMKEHTAIGHNNITQLNFTMFGCLEDCTRGGVCGDCNGTVGPTGGVCSYFDTHAMDVCLGSYPGSIAIYNMTDTIVCYLDCCEGVPYCMNRIKVNVTSNVEDIFKRTLIVRWNKIPVKINILTFYNK